MSETKRHIYWRDLIDVPRKVKLYGNTYLATTVFASNQVVYWLGHEANVAQEFLNRWVKQSTNERHQLNHRNKHDETTGHDKRTS